MRVCFVSKELAGLRGGGIGTYVAEAGKALAERGHEAWLLTADPGLLRRSRLDRVPDFHRVVRVGVEVPERERPRFLRGGDAYAYSDLVHRTLLRLDQPFDYIEFPDYGAEGFVCLREQALFRTFGATVLGVMLHSPTRECLLFDDQDELADLARRELCSLEDEAIRSAPLLQCPSLALAERVRERLSLTAPIHTLRYPLAHRPVVAPPPRSGRRLEELGFLYFGRIEQRKGVIELVEAFRRMPDLRLHIVGGDVPYAPGGGSLRRHLERTRPSNVTFAGAMDRSDLLDLVARTDVCIFPSRFENWPNACLEAMALGRVVIGSRAGGMAEMIRHGTDGLLVEGGSHEDLVRVVRDELGTRLDQLEEIGRSAAARARELADPGRYVDELVARVRAFTDTAASAAPVTATAAVSVVLPFGPDRPGFEAALATARDQTRPADEILVVPSHRPTATQGERGQPVGDHRIRVLDDEAVEGRAAACNRALAEASGDALLFLAEGQTLRRDALETLATALAAEPVAYAAGQTAEVDSTRGETWAIGNPMPFERSTSLLDDRFALTGALLRRDALAGLRFDELALGCEDWALALDLSARGARGAIVPRPVLVRRRASSVSDPAADLVYPQVVARLVAHHLPEATPSERQLVATVFATSGPAIAATAAVGHLEPLQAVWRIARRFPRLGAALFRIADVLDRVSQRLTGPR